MNEGFDRAFRRRSLHTDIRAEADDGQREQQREPRHLSPIVNTNETRVSLEPNVTNTRAVQTHSAARPAARSRRQPGHFMPFVGPDCGCRTTHTHGGRQTAP